jgi:hypothetical protein
MTLEQLEAQRAAVPDDDQLPASATQADLRALHERRRDLDARLQRARTALATLDTVREPDPRWEGQLRAWRETLSAELLARIRDPKLLGLQRTLMLSIKTIDFGPDVLQTPSMTSRPCASGN